MNHEKEIKTWVVSTGYRVTLTGRVYRDEADALYLYAQYGARPSTCDVVHRSSAITDEGFLLEARRVIRSALRRAVALLPEREFFKMEADVTDDEILSFFPKHSGSFTAHAPATDVYQEICRWTPEKDVGMQPGQPWKHLNLDDIQSKKDCPDCGGTGEIQLFVSTVPCERCRG